MNPGLSMAVRTCEGAIVAQGGNAWGRAMLFINLVLWIGQIFAAHNVGAAHLPHGHPLTREQANTFLLAAMHAETIKEPLQRCLAYPDPPGSHWNHEAVVAYCQYRYQPIVTLAQGKKLIQSGHGAKLDKLFARTLREQLNDPVARGRLDRTFYADFNNGSTALRRILDAWKRQSPRSAFAYAASGTAYMQMAFDARGYAYIQDTPQRNINAMDRLAKRADADLRKAIQLDPRITPAYRAMVMLGGLNFPRAYGLRAAKRGLEITPDNYSIYGQVLWLEQPKWGGSLAGMTALSRQAWQHAKHNPLLTLLAGEVTFYRIENSSCSDAEEVSDYIAALDQFGGLCPLRSAGEAANRAGDFPAMLIYLSEYLRFDSDADDVRLDRIHGLVSYDQTQWAIADADKVIAKSPKDRHAFDARGLAYQEAADLPRAEHDFETALRLDASDQWALEHLVGIYMTKRQWDKAWDTANHMIQMDPQDPGGWMMRAQIEEGQPRTGLRETMEYMASHFGKSPGLGDFIAHLQAVVRRREMMKSKEVTPAPAQSVSRPG